MLRAGLTHQEVGKKPGWRWRSHEISRIEGFSDAVFGFAVTLLVVSLEVPKTFTELYEAMHGFVAFAISFALLFQVWFAQYHFFRRYGLQDSATILMNSMLLFMVLFYVYPLKFLFNLLVLQLTGGSLMVKLADGRVEEMLTDAQAPTLMIVYGCGTVAVCGLLALMYWHAWRKREVLELSEFERLDTKQSIGAQLITGGVALLSAVIASGRTPRAASYAGMLYPVVLPIAHTVWGTVCGRRKRRLLKA